MTISEDGVLLKYFSLGNAAKAFASRQGLGKQRHVQTRYLWIQNQVAMGVIRIIKVKTAHNYSDILTKVMPGVTIQKHMQTCYPWAM